MATKIVRKLGSEIVAGDVIVSVQIPGVVVDVIEFTYLGNNKIRFGVGEDLDWSPLGENSYIEFMIKTQVAFQPSSDIVQVERQPDRHNLTVNLALLADGRAIEVSYRKRKYPSSPSRGRLGDMDNPYGKARLYFSFGGETVLGNLANRGQEPRVYYKTLVTTVLETLVIDGVLGSIKSDVDTSIVANWSRKAGCTMCPCSPGFILSNGLTGYDIWATIYDNVDSYEAHMERVNEQIKKNLAAKKEKRIDDLKKLIEASTKELDQLMIDQLVSA